MDISVSTPRFTTPQSKLGLAILVVALVGIGAYFFFISPTTHLRGVRYIAGTFEHRGLYEMGWNGPKAVALPVPARVVDYARQGKVEAAIVVAEGGEQDIYRIEGNNAERLTMDGKIKSGLTLSPDGSSIAYSQRITPASSTASVAEFYDPKEWQVMRLSVSDPNHAPVFMGNGFGPQFFSYKGALHLVYSADKTLHFVNLSTNVHQDIPTQRGVLIGLLHVVVSPDGAYLALPDVASGYSLYALSDQQEHFVITPLSALPAATVSVGFSGGSIFSIGSYNGVSAVRLGSVSQPSVIQYGYLLPDERVIKVIP